MNTVYVIGAGASEEVGLPIGHGLKTKISELLNMTWDNFDQQTGDFLIADAIKYYLKEKNGNIGDFNSYIHEAWKIRDALPQAISIDNFIDAHRHNQKLTLCGKLAIVRAILMAEENSSLQYQKKNVNSTINFNLIGKTWYASFFKLLTENCTLKDLERRLQTVSLVIFNYDRCIEHYLVHAFSNYYGISEAGSANLIKQIKIYHPYGSVGNLPWQTGADIMDYGAEPKVVKLLNLAERIKTFTEENNNDSSDINEIRNNIAKCDRLVFMGFAFHSQNLKLIQPRRIYREPSEMVCFATTFGISIYDERIIERHISNLLDERVSFQSLSVKCKDFFDHFWLSLRFNEL